MWSAWASGWFTLLLKSSMQTVTPWSSAWVFTRFMKATLLSVASASEIPAGWRR